MPGPRPARDSSAQPTATHSCAARGCSAQLPPRLLMCGPHWRHVPADVRASVWLAYRRGQERDGRPSRAYLDAVSAAVDAVAHHGRRHT